MRWLIVLALAGCYAPRGTRCEPCSGIAECPGGLACISGTCQEAAGACSARDDSGTEAMPPGEAPICFGVTMMRPFFEVCPAVVMPGSLVLPPTIDTTSAQCTTVILENAAAGNPDTCVIAADQLVVSGVTRVTGTRPLALWARSGIQIIGRLELNGANNDPVNAVPAPSANLCPFNTGGNGNGGGGGAGGTFAALGGGGGAGDSAGAAVAAIPYDINLIKRFRGGCRGGNGGLGQGQHPAGLGGNGGGAIYLLSPNINISGMINASGGGARAAQENAGGGGGGSGGMILLWSQDPIVVQASARVFALGGGGGSGGGATQAGALGDDPNGPQSSATDVAPLAGSCGGIGGGGMLAEGTDGIASGGTMCGGGGGGGAIGLIKIIPLMPFSGMNFAPTPI